MQVLGPDGKELRVHTRTLVAPGARAQWRVPIALSDPEGAYRLRARDVATGISAEHEVQVK